MDNTFDSMFYEEGEFIGGIDESGVSDIAGPLCAACVILPKIDLHRDDLRIFEVDDSKKIPERYRKQHAEIVWQVALGIGIGEVYPSEIDYLGKLNAVKLAMLRAVAACTKPNKKPITPDFLLVDGEITLPTTIPHKLIRRADEKSLAVAAASIVSKVYRDEIMIKLHEKYPHYDWLNNKGYPCEKQFQGLDKVGMQIGIHRARYWPFVRSKKTAWETKEWSERRLKWKQITEDRLIKELGQATKRELFSVSNSLKSPLETVLSAPY
ncbi:MAG: ribonuclease HII [Proteobacteria bacterium]|nr:ribonuclease HII [Pseudomonadota bacterium]NDD04485.1 ribonuclease HII [Pseudomonadota bacterium]NDG27922.1 ribonuclease HII [Pseudomonadota bacterium]